MKRGLFISMLGAAFLIPHVTVAAECKTTESLKSQTIAVAEKQSSFALMGAKTNVTAEDLNEFEFTLKTYKATTEGGLTFVADSLTDTDATYKTLYVFNQYKMEGREKYGVSIRLEIDFKAKNTGLSVANLFGLFGVKGTADKLDGTISMSVHGMRNPKAAYILPVPTKIDEASAAQFLNYMALVKSMIGEANSIDPVKLPSCI